ncbi:MAG: GSU2403 family nucleotidyltransferase fold protein [Kiritimatiellia bacterium]
MNVLRRLHEAGVLEHIVLIGSWCLVLYRDYFHDAGTIPAVRTRDMDFLVPSLTKPKTKTDVPDLLKDLGFIAGLRGQAGVMILEHPELLIEFLVPEHGRGGIDVQPLPRLGVNAQPLRFMDIALSKTVQLHFEGIPVTAPHPAAFVLHKLLVAPRRASGEKREKDINAALLVLDLFEKREELLLVRSLLNGFPRPWQRSILHTLRENHRETVAELMAKN